MAYSIELMWLTTVQDLYIYIYVFVQRESIGKTTKETKFVTILVFSTNQFVFFHAHFLHDGRILFVFGDFLLHIVVELERD